MHLASSETPCQSQLASIEGINPLAGSHFARCIETLVGMHGVNVGTLRNVRFVQVGLKMHFQGAQGQLMFFFGNKGDHMLERLICAVPPSGQFTFQQGPVPPQLEPKKQIQVPYLADTGKLSAWMTFCIHTSPGSAFI